MNNRTERLASAHKRIQGGYNAYLRGIADGGQVNHWFEDFCQRKLAELKALLVLGIEEHAGSVEEAWPLRVAKALEAISE